MADHADLLKMGALGAQGGMPGGETQDRLCGFLPSLSFNSPFALTNALSGTMGYMNQAHPIFQLNPSNPNGLLSKILRALGIDKMQVNMQGAQRNQHEYEAMSHGDPIRPGATPHVDGGGGGIDLH